MRRRRCGPHKQQAGVVRRVRAPVAGAPHGPVGVVAARGFVFAARREELRGLAGEAAVERRRAAAQGRRAAERDQAQLRSARLNRRQTHRLLPHAVDLERLKRAVQEPCLVPVVTEHQQGNSSYGPRCIAPPPQCRRKNTTHAGPGRPDARGTIVGAHVHRAQTMHAHHARTVHLRHACTCTTHALQVRLTAQLATTLLCSRSDGAGSGSSGGKADGDGGGGGGSGSGAQGEAAPLPIPLGGAADAVLLARHAAARGGALPILVSPALWAMRAMPPSRLPESIAEQDCTIEACELP